MRIPEQYRAAEALEGYLRDPMDPETAISYQRSIELDEREEYPQEANDILDRWGLNHYYIPLAYGGKLTSFEELLALMKVISRRDLTVALAHGLPFLAAATVWLGGSAEKKRALAEIIR